MKPLRILYVRDRLTVHDRRFVAAIVAQGHSPVVVCLANELDIEEAPELGTEFAVCSAAGLAALASSQKVDVVHVGPIPTVAFVAATHLPTELPLVAVSWGRDVLLDCDQNQALREQALFTIDRADTLLVDCDAVRRRVLSWRPKLDTPFVRFPWGIDLRNYHAAPHHASAALRRELGWNECTVFVSTRSWESIYGIDVLIRAFASVAKTNASVRLLLVGDGTLRPALLTDIEARGLRSHVHIPGRIAETQLPVWYGAGDVYVSSSPCDGSSVSLLEAMASAMPAIAHFEHGNPEWITPHVNGWLTDCRDANLLANCMADAVKRRTEWSSMGRISRATVVQNADWARNSIALTDAYRLAIHRERRT